ncbi:MAG: BtpA/SgcQ family protein [bacterium]|nr:BtpA/SgcQ family protein [bacterium]
MASRQLIGMVHALPLPGSPSYLPPTGAIVERAVEDAILLEESGFDALLVENYGDAPFFADRVPPITVASLARVVAAVRAAVDIPVGVNVLRNDAISALSIAAACDARFIRVNVLSSMMYTDQGPIVGQAARVARLRASLNPEIEVLADLFVKHATPPPGLCLEDAATDLRDRGMADGIILSGRGTGLPADEDMLRQVRQAVPDTRLLVGSGVDKVSVASVLRTADGVIVGTAIKEEGDVRRPVDPARAQAFVQAARCSEGQTS